MKQIKQILLSKDFVIFLIIFTIALFVRILYLAQLSSNPAFCIPVIDSATYDEIARRLIYDGVMNDRYFWQSFFYPFFLSRLYYFTGQSIIAAKLFGLFLGSFTCALLYCLFPAASRKTVCSLFKSPYSW